LSATIHRLGCTIKQQTKLLVLDSSPLIYLAKLDALDAIRVAGYRATVPMSVARETSAGGLAFRHPDAGLIAGAFRDRMIDVENMTEEETGNATRLQGMAGGLSRADADVLALGPSRSAPVCLAERQASRLARSLGLEVVGVVQLLFDGTVGRVVLEERIRSFAELTQLRIRDLNVLLAEARRRPR